MTDCADEELHIQELMAGMDDAEATISELQADNEKLRADVAVLRERLASYAKEINPEGDFTCDICLGTGEWPDEIKHRPDCILSAHNPGAALLEERDRYREVVKAAEHTIRNTKIPQYAIAELAQALAALGGDDAAE